MEGVESDHRQCPALSSLVRRFESPTAPGADYAHGRLALGRETLKLALLTSGMSNACHSFSNTSSTAWTVPSFSVRVNP